MQSPGPPYPGPSVVSPDLYANRSYDNHILGSHGLSSNNYLGYHTEGSHQSTYSGQSQTHYNNSNQSSHATHGAHGHYDSSTSQSYGQSVNHFNDMYTCGSGRNVYAANIQPSLRPPIPSSNVKYWNSEQMSQNSHNYNHGIPPPPLVSRTQGMSSPPCNTSNSYNSGVSGHSPQGWTRPPTVLHSPRTTPSPLASQPHASHSRSPSHVPQQFSPTHTSHSGLSESSQQQSVQKPQINVSYNSNQNNTSSQVNASNPLQSLQKMVMIDSDNSDIRSGYEDIPTPTLQNNGSVPLTPNLIQKTYNSDQSINNDPESPYPTYYNLDQNRLCTPPRPSPVSGPALSFGNIPDAQTDGFTSSESQMCESENELKKDNTSDKNKNNKNDLIYGFDDNCNVESKTATDSQLNGKVLRKAEDSVTSVNGENLNEEVNKTDSSVVNTESSSTKLAHESTQEQSRVPAICKRTSSRDSLQSTDSETTHSTAYADSRASHNWQMNQMEKEYFANQSENKNMWWNQNSLPQTSQPAAIPQTSSMSPINAGLSAGYLTDCRPAPPPALTPVPSMSYPSSHMHPGCGPGSWAPSASSSHSSTPSLNTSNKHFASPKGLRNDSLKKKRGRPFGSKNRRNSEDTGSETNVSDTPSPVKKRKKSIYTEEVGINTTVSIDAHGFDELAVVNPIKLVSGSSKRKKLIGPFIRIEKGRGRKATLYSIVNASTKLEDEKDVKTKSHFSNTESHKHMRRPSLVSASKKVVSTLSPHYDLNTRDKTWVCALCHKGPHFKGLGDLYGPYYITPEDKNKSNQMTITTPLTTSANNSSNTCTYDSIEETINCVIANEVTTNVSTNVSTNEKKVKNIPERRRKSDNSEDATNKLPKQTLKTITSINTLQSNDVEASHSQTIQSEVWIHEDCIVWSSGVYLVGHRVRNLEEIIIESNENICTKCKLSGATLGCLQKSCNTSQFHYLCAKEKGCDLDEENFSLYCPKHKKKVKDVTKCNSEEPSISSSNKV